MSDTTVLWQVLALALAVSAISTTIALSVLFKPVRRWVRARSRWLGRLLSCPYCCSHWIAFAAVAWYHPRVFDGWWLANYVVVVFAVVAVAAVVTGVVRNLNYFWADPDRIEDRHAAEASSGVEATPGLETQDVQAAAEAGASPEATQDAEEQLGRVLVRQKVGLY